jgi:beta-lactamase regulating signal transducer with metallopeptidase domain
MTEPVLALFKVQLALSLALALVIMLRRPVRKLFGAPVAYRLWACPPLAALAVLFPARTAPGVADADPLAGLASGGVTSVLAALLLIGWTIGIVVFAARLWRAQAAFLREADAGRAGPAVVGVLAPRLVMPADAGYSPAERALVREHELTHIARGDHFASALIALVQTVAWFNPMVHLAARLARQDQELACDSAVLRPRFGARAVYARALLKTQLAQAALPLGCYWPARSRHPLEERIALVGAEGPAFAREGLGAALVLAATVAVAGGAWAVQPPRPPSPAFAWPAPPLVILIDIAPKPAAHLPVRSGRKS